MRDQFLVNKEQRSIKISRVRISCNGAAKCSALRFLPPPIWRVMASTFTAQSATLPCFSSPFLNCKTPSGSNSIGFRTSKFPPFARNGAWILRSNPIRAKSDDSDDKLSADSSRNRATSSTSFLSVLCPLLRLFSVSPLIIAHQFFSLGANWTEFIFVNVLVCPKWCFCYDIVVSLKDLLFSFKLLM